MAWFQYVLSHTTPEANRELYALPGLVTRERSVNAHENSGWLVERVLERHGINFTVRLMKADFDGVDNFDKLVSDYGLREWVPDFMTAYQRDAVIDLAGKSGHLWHAAGSGKTLTSIVWSLCHPGNTIVTTRAAVRRQFGREIERFTKHRALVIETKADCTPEILEETDALFLVIGWEMLPDCIDTILRHFKPVNWVADEMHKCKSHKRWGATPTETGKLTFNPLDNIAHAAMKLSRSTKRRLAATATPIKDRVRDLWAQLDLIHPDAWGPFYREDKASFAGRYCAARRGFYGGIETTGSSNLDELWDRVSLVTHHVPHSVTHRHLPPRRRLVTYVPSSDQVRAAGFQKTMKQAAKAGRGALLEAKLMEAAARKRKAVVEILEEAVAGGQKVIVFTGRREDCDELGSIVTEKFGHETKVLVGHGGTPAAIRDAMQQEYMASSGPTILVGTGDAWGEGVNLQDSDLLLVAMLPYTPGQVVQWEGRVARHGQKRPVMIQYLVAEHTVDEHVAGILLDKLPAVERVSKDDSVDGLADQLRGADQEEAILESILSKLAESPAA